MSTEAAMAAPTLPILQLVILSLCRIAEPLALTSVFPYLPEMMEHMGIQTDSVAAYAGLVSGIFSLSQSLTGVAWGRASDVHGRKPAILTGLICLMITTILFGFSRTVSWALVTRGLAGMATGNVGIIRTTVAELVPHKELQPRAFSIMPLIWIVGSIFGPTVGGALAEPAVAHPGLFPADGFFGKFPFVLPNLVVSGFLLVGFIMGYLYLQETLETRKDRPDYGLVLGQKLKDLLRGRKQPDDTFNERTRLLGDSEDPISQGSIPQASTKTTSKPAASPATYSQVLTRQTTINLIVYTLLALHSVAFDQLIPIFLHYPRHSLDNNPNVHLPFKFASGFGLGSRQIGFLFTVYGICGILTQFFAFPLLAQRFGILNCLKVSASVCPAVYILAPFTVLVRDTWAEEVSIFLLMFIKSVAAMFAFPCSIILLTNSASSLLVLGTLNGIATSVSSLGRAAGPALGGWTFSIGVRAGYVILPWWTIALLAVIGAVPVWYLEERDRFAEGGGDGVAEGEVEAVDGTPSPGTAPR
ncbi:MAG: hypothetical protein M1823_004792 [Watsoniomyces obsoletus]|nr:MAG: hypothetical protein M1823_004792 [Watsoniomyces obsoletus]